MRRPQAITPPEKLRAASSGPMIYPTPRKAGLMVGAAHVEVPPVKFREIAGDRTGETSAQIRGRVVAARQRQQKRFAHKPKITCNARMEQKELKAFCALDEATKGLLQNAMTDLNLSARAYDRILKVARTIADLEGAEHLAVPHLAEAIQYRTLDRSYWA